MAFRIPKNRTHFQENIIGQTISDISTNASGYLKIHLTSNQYFSIFYELDGSDYDTYVCVRVYSQQGESIFQSWSQVDNERETFGEWIVAKGDKDQIDSERFIEMKDQKIVALKQKRGACALVMENGLELQLQVGFKEHYDVLIQQDGTIIAAQCVVQK